jgi:hypothetical protein
LNGTRDAEGHEAFVDGVRNEDRYAHTSMCGYPIVSKSCLD